MLYPRRKLLKRKVLMKRQHDPMMTENPLLTEDPPSPIKRHVKWKMARTNRYGKMTSEAARKIADKIVSSNFNLDYNNFNFGLNVTGCFTYNDYLLCCLQ